MRNAMLGISVVILSCLPLPAYSQAPAQQQECAAAKWGEGDQRGAANHMKPSTVLETMRLIQTGEVIELGHVLSASMPLGPGREFRVQTRETDPGFYEESVSTDLGQVGTQIDALSHYAIDGALYNCVPLEDVVTPRGFRKLGMENSGALVTRGVLLDIAALKGVAMLPDRYAVSSQDLRLALIRQNLVLKPGDAILIYTGWDKLWGSENARYLNNRPEVSVEASLWLGTQDPMIVGSEASMSHVLLLDGIYLLEHLKLDELSAKRVHEFALIVQPLKIQGGTGSSVAPIAIR
jgi:kynurenine formamidase